MRSKILATSLPLALLAACSTTPGGGARPPRGTEPMTNEDVLVLYSAGCDQQLTDPRDANLKAALELLDDRLRELPGELDNEEIPVPLIDLALEVLRSPMSLRLDFDPEGDWNAGPPATGQLTVQGSEDEIASISTRLLGFLSSVLPMPLTPVEEHPGLRALEFDGGRVLLGQNQGDFVACYGAPRPAELGLGSLDLPVGVEPSLAFKLDTKKLRAPLEMFLAMQGEEAAPIRAQLELLGLLGAEPWSIAAACGADGERGYFSMRLANYRQVLEAQGALAASPLSRADLAAIPADATLAGLSQFEPTALSRLFERISHIEGFDEQNPIELVEEMIGVDLEKQVLEPLGSTTGYYMSETTGGGGIASGIIFCSVDDRVALEGAIQQIVDLAVGLSYAETEGYVGVREWEHSGAKCWTLAFPGLPVPLEPTAALTDSRLFMAVTPQAAEAAVDQAASGSAGLAEVAAVRDAIGAWENVIAIDYQNSPQLARDGYGYATLAFAALSNAIRSRTSERGPNFVLPSLKELTAGAIPAVSVTRIEGNDIVALGDGDPSVTLNAAAVFGTLLPQIYGLAAAIGFATPTLMRREATLHEMQALEELEQLGYSGDEEEEY